MIIGCLEGALDDLAEPAATKRPAFNPRVVIGEDPVFQEKFADLHHRTMALDALLEQAGRVVMDRALAGDEPTPTEWLGYTGGHQHIHHEGIRILNEIMTLSGSSGLYNSHPLQRG